MAKQEGNVKIHAELLATKLNLHSLRFFEFPNLLNMKHQISPVHIFHYKIQPILNKRNSESIISKKSVQKQSFE